MIIGMKREPESPTNHLLGANMRVYLKMIRKQRFIYYTTHRVKWWYTWDGNLNNQPHIHLIKERRKSTFKISSCAG